MATQQSSPSISVSWPALAVLGTAVLFVAVMSETGAFSFAWSAPSATTLTKPFGAPADLRSIPRPVWQGTDNSVNIASGLPSAVQSRMITSGPTAAQTRLAGTALSWRRKNKATDSKPKQSGPSLGWKALTAVILANVLIFALLALLSSLAALIGVGLLMTAAGSSAFGDFLRRPAPAAPKRPKDVEEESDDDYEEAVRPVDINGLPEPKETSPLMEYIDVQAKAGNPSQATDEVTLGAQAISQASPMEQTFSSMAVSLAAAAPAPNTEGVQAVTQTPVEAQSTASQADAAVVPNEVAIPQVPPSASAMQAQNMTDGGSGGEDTSGTIIAVWDNGRWVPMESNGKSLDQSKKRSPPTV